MTIATAIQRGYSETATRFPEFPGFYGFHIQYADGRKPECLWFVDPKNAKRYAKMFGRRKSVRNCILIKKLGNGSVVKIKEHTKSWKKV